MDGLKGLVSAPRHRIGVLMMCTALVARQGTASPRLLSSILGCWIHALMFRRPILAILSHAFSEGLGRPQNEAFVLGRETRDELLALSCLGPVFNRLAGLLRSIYVFCTDASPDGAGICQAAESPDTVAELWRHSEQRGYYTQLLSPAAEILASKSEEFSDAQPHAVVDSQVRVPCSLKEGILFDCIELFRGEGNWTIAHEAIGFTAHSGIEVAGSGLQFGDILDPSVFSQLTSLAARGVVADWLQDVWRTAPPPH